MGDESPSALRSPKKPGLNRVNGDFNFIVHIIDFMLSLYVMNMHKVMKHNLKGITCKIVTRIKFVMYKGPSGRDFPPGNGNFQPDPRDYSRCKSRFPLADPDRDC